MGCQPQAAVPSRCAVASAVVILLTTSGCRGTYWELPVQSRGLWPSESLLEANSVAARHCTEMAAEQVSLRHAVDLECPPGTPVLAPAAATVLQVMQQARVSGIHVSCLARLWLHPPLFSLSTVITVASRAACTWRSAAVMLLLLDIESSSVQHDSAAAGRWWPCGRLRAYQSRRLLLYHTPACNC